MPVAVIVVDVPGTVMVRRGAAVVIVSGVAGRMGHTGISVIACCVMAAGARYITAAGGAAIAAAGVGTAGTPVITGVARVT